MCHTNRNNVPCIKERYSLTKKIIIGLFDLGPKPSSRECSYYILMYICGRKFVVFYKKYHELSVTTVYGIDLFQQLQCQASLVVVI